MQWSKLRTKVEAYFAESVKERVRLHSTRYRRMHDQEGRAWITIDGKEIVNMIHIFKWMGEVSFRAKSLAGESDEADSLAGEIDEGYWQRLAEKQEEVEQQLHEESFFWQGDLGMAMHDYLSMPIDEILRSQNPLLRAIGMLDRRVGKRRLAALEMTTEHPLVLATYQFRCLAEGVRINRG
jgi:hypothetical protein